MIENGSNPQWDNLSQNTDFQAFPMNNFVDNPDGVPNLFEKMHHISFEENQNQGF